MALVSFPSPQVQAAKLWARLERGEKPESRGKDGVPIYPDDPLAGLQRQLSQYLKQTGRTSFWKVNPEKYPAGRELLALAPPQRLEVLRAIGVRLVLWKRVEAKQEVELDPNRNVFDYDELMELVNANLAGRAPKIAAKGPVQEEYDCPDCFRSLVSELLRGKLPFSSDDLVWLMELAAEQEPDPLWQIISCEGVLRAVEQSAAAGELAPAVRQQLTRWAESIKSRYRILSAERKLLARITTLLGQGDEPGIEPGEAWSDTAIADLKPMSGQECSRWLALLDHCRQAENSKPSGKWLKKARELVEEIGLANFKAKVIRWFERVALPRPVHQQLHPHAHRPDPDLVIGEQNATVLRGLVWCCAGWQDPEISSALSALAEVCFKKVRWLGPRCPRVGNACLYSLSATSSEAAASQLSRLDSVVKQPTAKKRIDKSLNTAAVLTGQTRTDLEEKSVPTFGLGMEGKLTRKFGTSTAELQILDSRDVQIVWSGRDGQSLKSVPAEVKREHAAELKQFQKLAKDIQKMLAAQRIRLERLLMTEREWNFEAWQQRYLNHSLLAPLSRRLIWHFRGSKQSSLGAWLNGQLVDVNSRSLTWLSPDTQVRLWHPIGFPVETVVAWRRWLEANQVCQPFKQAHREVYMLTDAELQTAAYSNRFAAHIIGQHQFAALAVQRGWNYSFMGGFDFQSTPTLELPAWNLVAEFWVEPTGELADSGVSRCLATDQVRFLREDETVPLTEVPAPVFTEVLRDVDLFVGVCSIGNDPAWQDHGELEGGGVYWRRYSFGDLSASAKTRRDVLERLLPKLKIAKHCALQEKFLVVTGSLRTYKIHLGSGNILMAPNDQYLCIVPDRGSLQSDKVFLPFEGDNMLSIILSKAFLLAEDSRIKDQTILRQITSP